MFGVSSDTVLAIVNSVIVSNSVVFTGAGVHVQLAASVFLHECMIIYNDGKYSGGGVDILPFCNATINNSTISSNIALKATTPDLYGGGGISVAGVTTAAVLSMQNTIVWGNLSPFGNDMRCHIKSEVHANNCNIGNIYGALVTSNNVISIDPEFADHENGDFHLLYGSPCIDAGSTNAGASFDMDGEARPFGVAMDMGADEFVDMDGDNMADYWEVREYGAILTTDGTEDTDGDALDTFGEYMEQTDPHEGDTDGDSMPDGWEVENSLNAKVDDGGLDADGDKMNNADEYTADTDPQNSESLLRINQVYSDMGGLVLRWQGGVEAAQWIDRCDSLTGGTWKVIFGLPPPTPRTNAVIIFNSAERQYYRIRAERE